MKQQSRTIKLQVVAELHTAKDVNKIKEKLNKALSKLGESKHKIWIKPGPEVINERQNQAFMLKQIMKGINKLHNGRSINGQAPNNNGAVANDITARRNVTQTTTELEHQGN